MSSIAFSDAELRQLERVAALGDDAIDTDDIPEAPAENWSVARRATPARPPPGPVTVQLDADVLAWLMRRAPSDGYQSEVNRILRRHATDAERQG